MTDISNKGKILIVEDEKSMNDILKMLLEGEGYNVLSAYDGSEGIETIKKDIFDIVITDIRMPKNDGFAVLRSVKDTAPETIVLMITAFGTTEDAIEAMKLGAYDYINKPFKIDEIRLIVKNALEKRLLKREVKNLRHQILSTYRLENIIGKSKPMLELLMSLPKIADSNSSVLIMGESGCGKELIAHAVHNLSKRAGKDFVAINCAALPEGLLESELFGYMKGAFTGAASNKEGLFEVANNGTIFLDEIGDMPMTLQSKLLRVLEDGSFRRIGGTKDVTVDVRVVSATNKFLQDEAAAGRFRTDLYYRLNVIPVLIPPLRERREDIPVLIEHFFEKHGGKETKFSQDAMDLMMNYPWRGNVRELENIVERLLTFVDGPTICANDLPAEIRNYVMQKAITLSTSGVNITPEGVNLDSILEDIEMAYLKKSLEITGGIKTDAARLLNISFRQFRHRLKKYGID
ncbi:MAG: sigma-54-dependent Fis family transcriptional regulator [Nitrospirae bacterium]|uniref:sigma-54-dependent transcriptional regulator n=1 Tax=Candidatus Magnetobacterium casense TaxID=1455061 RepID=UPI00058E6B02|nr:sigma-54 dependent transcriptional regulator [Candidatus Magnetobacterium casensis]MBF0337560.1 sigma-54-dependent Fis family transcriptional regulator [Nitrospirota bacterium]